MMKKTAAFILLILVTKLTSCARVGSPDGGPKDSIPPVMAFAKPMNKTTSFKEKKITILFDEYIRFEKLTTQLIISPPMEKKPQIRPTTEVSKKITIEFLEELMPNTTYTINFGNSIVDNNEGNELGRFSYVFSTGPELDSLSVVGNIFDPLDEKELESISVMAYKNANDTLVGHYTPNYLTNTLKAIDYSLENLAEATYKVIALEDLNSNYKYDKGLERIGFLNESIDLKKPIDSIDFTIFLEDKDPKIFRPTQTKGNQIIFGFNGKKEPLLTVEGLNKNDYYISKEADKDSLYFWFKEIPADTLRLTLELDTLKQEFALKPRTLEKDSIKISSKINSTLHPRDTLTLYTNIPVDYINNDSIVMLEKDSIPIPFNIISDKRNHRLMVNFERQIKTNYSLILKEHAFTDFLNFNSHAKKISFNTLDPEEYGEIILAISNPNNINLIVELIETTKKEKITKIIKGSDKIHFKDLVANKYQIRIIKDENNNNSYDNGDFEKRRQPEKVINFNKIITLRANSEINENITVE